MLRLEWQEKPSKKLPNKPSNKKEMYNMNKSQVTITIDSEIKQAVKKEAESRGRSMSNMINYLLREMLKRIKEV